MAPSEKAFPPIEYSCARSSSLNRWMYIQITPWAVFNSMRSILWSSDANLSTPAWLPLGSAGKSPVAIIVRTCDDVSWLMAVMWRTMSPTDQPSYDGLSKWSPSAPIASSVLCHVSQIVWNNASRETAASAAIVYLHGVRPALWPIPLGRSRTNPANLPTLWDGARLCRPQANATHPSAVHRECGSSRAPECRGALFSPLSRASRARQQSSANECAGALFSPTSSDAPSPPARSPSPAAPLPQEPRSHARPREAPAAGSHRPACAPPRRS